MYVKLYISNVISNINLDNINIEERKEEIINTTNLDLRRQKYTSFLLLEKISERQFNKKIEFYKSNNKWLCKDFYFSISHKDNYVCVAISNSPVGVDIEKIDIKFSNLFEKILTLNEISKIKKDEIEKITKAWTIKEAVFKASSNKLFLYDKIDSFNYIKKIKTIKHNNYLITVYNENINNLTVNFVKLY